MDIVGKTRQFLYNLSRMTYGKSSNIRRNVFNFNELRIFLTYWQGKCRQIQATAVKTRKGEINIYIKKHLIFMKGLQNKMRRLF